MQSNQRVGYQLGLRFTIKALSQPIDIKEDLQIELLLFVSWLIGAICSFAK